MKSYTKPIIFGVMLTAAVLTFWADHLDHTRSSYRPTEWKKISPFTEMTFEEEGKIIAEYEDIRYELAAIGGITGSGLVKASKKHFGERWQKRIREDIADVLIAAGIPESDRVDLELKDLKTGAVRTVFDAKMTRENRAKMDREP